MHKSLKRFWMDGQIGDDSDFARLRAQYETLIVHDMKGQGYVPVLGFGPFWSTSYNKESEVYDFTLSLHGIYVGRKQSYRIQGITAEGRTIITPNK